MKNKSKMFSILDKTFTVNGTVHAEGQLIIKGTVKGTLVGDRVIIAEEGVVDAEADVARMTVGGKFNGSIRVSDKLVVLSTGKCSGKILCKDFAVEAGGELNAEINCRVDANAELEREALRLK